MVFLINEAVDAFIGDEQEDVINGASGRVNVGASGDGLYVAADITQELFLSVARDVSSSADRNCS